MPTRNRELYALLGELHETAADQISLSRFQLAQRGLESEVPVIRVAGEFLLLLESVTSGLLV